MPLSTILLIHTLRATIAHVEQTPDVAQNHPGLVEFKHTLLQYVATLDKPSHPLLQEAA